MIRCECTCVPKGFPAIPARVGKPMICLISPNFLSSIVFRNETKINYQHCEENYDIENYQNFFENFFPTLRYFVIQHNYSNNDTRYQTKGMARIANFVYIFCQDGMKKHDSFSNQIAEKYSKSHQWIEGLQQSPTEPFPSWYASL